MFIELAAVTREKVLVVVTYYYYNKSRVQQYNIFKLEKSLKIIGYILKSQFPMQMAQ